MCSDKKIQFFLRHIKAPILFMIQLGCKREEVGVNPYFPHPVFASGSAI